MTVPALKPLTIKPGNGERVYDVDDARNPTQLFPAWVADAMAGEAEWVEIRYDHDPEHIVTVEWRALYDVAS